MRVAAAAPASDRLLILDDIFPALASGFRLAEYNTYLERYPHALIRSTGAAFHFLGETRPFSAVVATYEAAYPEFAGRVDYLNPRTLPEARLVYVSPSHQYPLGMSMSLGRRLALLAWAEAHDAAIAAPHAITDNVAFTYR